MGEERNAFVKDRRATLGGQNPETFRATSAKFTQQKAHRRLLEGTASVALMALGALNAQATSRVVVPNRSSENSTQVADEKASKSGSALSAVVEVKPSIRQVFSEANSLATKGDFAGAALKFFQVQSWPEVEVDGGDAGDRRLRSEVELAHSLLAMGLFGAAIHQYDYVLRAGENHPAYVEAVEGVVLAGTLSGEDTLTSAILDREYGPAFGALPPHVLDRLNFAMGHASLRGGKVAEARGFLEAIPHESHLFAQAAYLRGVCDAREGKHGDALTLFESALTATSASQIDPLKSGQKGVAHGGNSPLAQAFLPTSFSTASALAAKASAQTHSIQPTAKISAEELRELSLLAKARTHYALGEFGKAVQTYESIPRFSRFWEDALFENGWARTLNGDDSGALGTLQALHAPQLARSFQPESWILFATIQFNRCLFPEARQALASYRTIYAPLRDALRQALKPGTKNSDEASEIMNVDRLPKSVAQDVKRSRRYASLTSSIRQLEAEHRIIESVSAWQMPVRSDVGTDQKSLSAMLLAKNQGSVAILRRVLADFVQKRGSDALIRLDDFDARGEILELEIQRVETSQLEAHFDREKALSNQSLGRPPVAEDHVYWPYDGEFWRDEVGHYRFTVKDGCAPQVSDSSRGK